MTLRLFFLCLLTISLAAPCARAGVEHLSEAEFRELATDLAPKVNFFRDTWARDPAAEFYGGTTRDFLYWVKGKFRDAKSKAEAHRIASDLRKLPAIDVRQFIIGESDVDVFTEQSFAVDPAAYGVRKIDRQSPDVLDPTTELGQNERKQGYIPAEKIRLSQEGFRPGELGDGLGEIYRGQLSVHFAAPEVFAETKYAKEGLNHPVLLALRYLRLQAIDYFQTFGPGLPDRDRLLRRLDPASAAEVRKVIEGTLDGETLKPYLEKDKFRSWINGAIQKAFRSYTNPTAAKLLMDEFGVTQLPERYTGKIEPVNQYVFAQYRDGPAIERALKDYSVDVPSFFEPVERAFPDGFLYHGTKEEKAFRSILFQGVLGSEKGSAGKGLYGVAEENKSFAENWALDKSRLLRFPVRKEAKLVDVAAGEGKRVFDVFEEKTHAGFDGFADTFGVDILRYPYTPPAYVVKNSAVLGRAEGVHRQVLPLDELLERARGMKNLNEFLDLISVNSVNEREAALLVKNAALDPAEIEAALRRGDRREDIIRYLLPTEPFHERADLMEELARTLNGPERSSLVQYVLAKPPWNAREDFLLKLVGIPGMDFNLQNYLLENGAVPPLRRLARKMLEEGVQGSLLYRIFRQEPYRGDGELFLAYLSRKDAPKYAPELVSLLKDPAWAGRRDLVDALLERGFDGEVAQQLLKEPGWRNEPGLLERIFAAGRADPQLVSAVIASGPTEENVSYLRRILARGPSADWATLRAILPFHTTWGPYREELVTAILAHPDQPLDLLAGLLSFTEDRARFLPAVEKAYLAERFSNSVNAAEVLSRLVSVPGVPTPAMAAKLDDALLFDWTVTEVANFDSRFGGARYPEGLVDERMRAWAERVGRDERFAEQVTTIVQRHPGSSALVPLLRALPREGLPPALAAARHDSLFNLLERLEAAKSFEPGLYRRFFELAHGNRAFLREPAVREALERIRNFDYRAPITEGYLAVLLYEGGDRRHKITERVQNWSTFAPKDKPEEDLRRAAERVYYAKDPKPLPVGFRAGTHIENLRCPDQFALFGGGGMP